MADKRKLMAEIQQTLKKIDEGVIAFDDIFEKLNDAESQTLKEKYADNLKTELKKLQRFREQIKSWAGNKDIKDMNELLEKRKTIEIRMEQFKVCEKDTKVKAYSREGLAREARSDPKEQEREEKRTWIGECIEKLTEVQESMEAEIEKLDTPKLRAKNKEQIDLLDRRVKRSKWHATKLEAILRQLDDEEVDPSNINSIKDDVEYYIETAAEDNDFETDIYEDLNLSEIAATVDIVSGTSIELSVSAPVSTTTSSHSTVPVAATGGGGASSTSDPSNVLNLLAQASKKAPSTPEVKVAVATKATAPAATTSAATSVTAKSSVTSTAPTPLVPTAKPASNQPAVAASPAITAKDATLVGPAQKKVISSAETAPTLAPKPSALRETETKSEPTPSSSWASTIKATTPAPTVTAAAMPPLNTNKVAVTSASPSPAPTPVSAPTQQAAAYQQQQPVSGSPTPPNDINKVQQLQQLQLQQQQQQQQLLLQQQQQQQQQQAALLVPQPVLQSSIGIPEERPQSSNPAFENPLWNSIRISSFFAPEAIDSKPQFPTHPSFPQQALSGLDTLQTLEKMSIDSLFYIFYFQGPSYITYLAAKILKEKHQFRYHKGWNRWLQREEGEAHRITPEFEFGSYKCFEFSEWRLLVKKDLKFEYAFVENELT